MHSATGTLKSGRPGNSLRNAAAPALVLIALACGLVKVAAAEEGPANPVSRHVSRMSFLDNGAVRVGVDLNLGGAITYLSPSGTNQELNVINTHDWGRQVQLSYYSGPVPYQPPGTRMSKAWEFLGWNPIQSGDCFGHESRVLDHSNNGRSMYTKCIPMHWPLENVPGECECEVWLELSGSAVKARCRLTNHRPDKTQYSARHQELPAVYVNGPFYRLMTYTGDKPFSGGELTRIVKRAGEPGPWSQWVGTENWAAQVNDAGWGLGVWNPGAMEFTGGFAGKPGAGGPLDNPTGYIAPIRAEILDHNIVYEYRYELILGTLEDIRAHVYRHRSPPGLPMFRFAGDRQGWFYRDATDSGWPISGGLEVALDKTGSQILSPVFFIKAEDAPNLAFEGAFSGVTNSTATNVKISWRRLSQSTFPPEQARNVPGGGSAKAKRYTIQLADLPGYSGVITQLRLEPAPSGTPGVRFTLNSVAFLK